MTARTKNWGLPLALGGVLAVLTLAAYWPVLGQGFINYDDGDYVTQNLHVANGLSVNSVIWAFRASHSANWHPLTWISHMLDVQAYGLNAHGHHLTSLLLHVANTLLLFRLLWVLTRRLWPSVFVAGLFALHPLHVESVAWVAERKDVLSGFFFFLTLLAYARYAAARPRPTAAPAAAGGKGIKSLADRRAAAETPTAPIQGGAPGFYGLTLFLFALGLMSKPMLVTLPCVLLLLDGWPLGRMDFTSRAAWRRTLLPLLVEKIPFLLLSAASSAITVAAQAGAATSFAEYGWGERLANAICSYLKYLGKAAWPQNLSIFYPHPWVNHAERWSSGQIALAALLLAGISLWALYRMRRERWLAMGWFWYLGMLVPVIGIIQVGSQAIADRYTYLPLIGVFVCVVWALADRLSGQGRVAVAVLGGAVLLGGAALTRHQVGFWQNDFTLFEHALAVSERNATAHGNLAIAYAAKGDYPSARKHCDAALAADPSDYISWHLLGCLDLLAGQPQESIRHLRSALRWRPDAADTWFQLGRAFAATEAVSDAIVNFQTAVRFDPDLAAAYNNLGAAYLFQGRRDDALKAFAETVRIEPKSAESHYNLGTTLVDGGRLQEGEAQLAEAVRLNPTNVEALAALAGVLASEGRTNESFTQFQAATNACPRTAEARFKLGNALLTSGFTNQSAAAFAESLRLEPTVTQHLLETAKKLLAQGQLQGALVRLQAVVRLEPGNAEAHDRLGLLLANSAKLDEAAAQLAEAARLAPQPETLYHLGLVLGRQGKLDQALVPLRRVVQMSPGSAIALNDLAWILATAPQAELRNGAEAVALAERAARAAGGDNLRVLSTLAAAYAEAGRFAEAVSTAERTRNLALATGDKAQVQTVLDRLELYRNHQALRQ